MWSIRFTLLGVLVRKTRTPWLGLTFALKRQLLAYLLWFPLLACVASPTEAALFPRSLDELKKADLIVVGTISEIRIVSERSRIEGAFGNYDWGIYVTLAVDTVEKGQFTDPKIEFRCFRIKHRRGMMEYFSPGGHHPIPAEGTRVRAFLYKRDTQWIAALPNGLTASDANDNESVIRSSLGDAPEITALRSRRYTYGLPLELWVIIATVASIILMIVVGTRWFINRRKRRMRSAF